MTDSVSPEVASFFQDPDASSAVVLAAQQIAAPMVVGAALTAEETMMGGSWRVVEFLFDGSPSMAGVAAMLRNGFNNDFVPAVKDAREDDISALRIGGMSFSSDAPKQIWKGADGSYFHPIDELPGLTGAEYDPDQGWGTALHRAIMEGSAVAHRYAAELQAETGMDGEIDIIILSDGMNNEAPLDASGVKQMITGRDPSRVRYVFFYFDTGYGHWDVRSYAVNELGIDAEQVEVFEAKPGETAAERAQRFRRLMAVMSRVSAARNTSAVVATSAVYDDEELV